MMITNVPRSFLLSFILLATNGITLVNAAAWVAGFQSTGFVGWNLRQYTHLFEGNPREVASLIGADQNSLPGVVCGTWTEFKIIGNSNPGIYEFNCVPTPSEIDANAQNDGFFVGGLNHEGVTMALCHIQYSGAELCDSDSVTDASDEACNVWVVFYESCGVEFSPEMAHEFNADSTQVEPGIHTEQKHE
ncbi:hypothetical protein EV368DRAFT_87954 [Lentinula lateritia]|uniref:Uncharacterized protein n=1 Tax=Lentinula aff. lateritia TaxID=2804960 RepID=A0ACC1TKF9_9AGAR|nr:hypothetical protein F5876DRAFT_82194 [Lentinula aff. lateritia]KAJ3847244.1 hypothetical protein EV368DRAFT_87954 [Lentinula lateritia]